MVKTNKFIYKKNKLTKKNKYNKTTIALMSFNIEGMCHKNSNIKKYIEKWKNKEDLDIIAIQELFLKNDLLKPFKYDNELQLKLGKMIVSSNKIENTSNIDECICLINKNSKLFDCYQYIIKRVHRLQHYLGYQLSFIYDGFTGGIFFNSDRWEPIETYLVDRLPKLTNTKPNKTCLVVKFKNLNNNKMVWVVNIHLKAGLYGMYTRHINELSNIINQLKKNGWNGKDDTILMGDFNNSSSKHKLVMDGLNKSNISSNNIVELCCNGKYTQHTKYMVCEDLYHTIPAKLCNIYPINNSLLCNNSYDGIIYLGNKKIKIMDRQIYRQDDRNPSADHDIIYSKIEF